MHLALYFAWLLVRTTLLTEPDLPARAVSELGLAAPLNQSIRTNGNYSASRLVRDIFAKGACENISNIKAIGDLEGLGYFDRGAAVIGMERGIILATGPIYNAHGPNIQGDRSGGFGDTSGDPDLDQLATGRVLDAVGIEFDFVPLDSFVRFRYVFASEEYCEFVGSVYNDVFGFFISGPGINGSFSRGARNVALLPGSNDYVAINSVNHLRNANHFVRNELERDARQCGLEPIQSPYHSMTEFDGFTKVLTASLQLIPCETYHIRLVVGDVSDKYYDSAVFLEAESFNIGGTVQLSAHGHSASTAIEGCDDAYFLFRRGEPEGIDKALTVRFKIAAASTAVEGTDFEALPRTITIPANQMLVRLPVHFYNDGIIEPTESLILELDIPCACYGSSATMLVTDPPPILLQMPNAQVCRDVPTTLTPTVNGGIPPYTYRWSNDALTPNITITPGTTPVYSITVTDRCGNTQTDSILLRIVDPPTALLSGYAEICAGDTAYLQVVLTGAPPWQLIYTINDVPQPSSEPIYTTQYRLPVTLPGIYHIQKVIDGRCTGTGTGIGRIDRIDIQLLTTVKRVSCYGGSDGRIAVQPVGGEAPYRLRWGGSFGAATQLANLSAGYYQLTVTDAKGCINAFQIEVPEAPPLGPITFECEALTDPDFSFSAQGGTPPYDYALDGFHFQDARIFEQLIPGVSYAITIRDAVGCLFKQTLLLPPTYERMVELPRRLQLKVGETYQWAPKLNIPETLISEIEWIGEQLSCNNCLQPMMQILWPGTYTLRITDVFGCIGDATTMLLLDPDVDLFIPTAFSPNGDGFNDYFTIYADVQQVQRVLSLEIYDRWGSQVFVRKNFYPNEPENGWNGTVAGCTMRSSVFLYVARLQLVNGTEIVRTGDVALIR